MKFCLSIALLCLAMSLLSCGGGESATDTAGTGTSESDQAQPTKELDSKKLVIEDLKTGTGAVAHWGDQLEVLYIGTFLDRNEEFVRRWGKDVPPLPFHLGYAAISPGWGKGIEGMRVGGTRRLLIPSRLAYKNGPVEYLVRLIAARPDVPKVGSYPQEGPFATISGGKVNEKPHIDPADRPASKQLLTRDLEEGAGPAAQMGDEVGIYYAGAVYETGEVKYYGWPPAPPATFPLGSDAFGRVWESGIVGMRAGGIREMVAPSRLFSGTGAVDYVIEMVSLEPASRKP